MTKVVLLLWQLALEVYKLVKKHRRRRKPRRRI